MVVHGDLVTVRKQGETDEGGRGKFVYVETSGGEKGYLKRSYIVGPAKVHAVLSHDLRLHVGA